MEKLLSMIEKLADKIIVNFLEDDVLDFLSIFEKVGLDILIKKITIQHNYHFDSFCKYLTRYKYSDDKTEEVQKAICNFFIENSKNENAIIRYSAIEALLNIEYKDKKYIEELFSKEKNPLIKSLLEGHLRPLTIYVV